MSRISHYPTPWNVEVMPSGRVTVTSGQFFVCGDENSYGLVDANAGHIVRCVNAHEYLVNALEHCKQVFLRYEINRVDHTEIEDEALKIIQGALAKAHPSGGDRHGE
ncbi:hypothetical protein [Brucella intermedia]|uniref:hypothetical protein n=1 Tax=Brucella intermedia TaxID=94625 RepID=UPI00158C1B5B|nr:hypothetical protein [Brucella intermedia]NYD84403.1 hypothetical protein [Brucella intermedia]